MRKRKENRTVLRFLPGAAGSRIVRKDTRDQEEKTAGKFCLRHVKFEMPLEKSNRRCPADCERLKIQVQKKGQRQRYKFEHHQHTDGI